jgi:CubicO group peptidase (beta-lactamase class C family)
VKRRLGTRLWFNRIYIDATPPTGLIGPASDAARLMMALSDGSVELSPETLALMRPHAGQRPLGWPEFAGGVRPWLQQRGGGPGFASIMRLYPEEGLGIVIVANGSNLDREGLADFVATIDW